MSIYGRWRGFIQFTTLASLLGLAACGSLLGIEDVHEDPALGGEAGRAGGESSAGDGQLPGAGHANVGGGAATAGKGGTGQGGTGQGGTGQSGGSSGAGVSGGGDSAGANAGTAGSAGAGTAVHGHVIDYWGHLLANVAIEVAGKTSTTDAQGAFSFDAVPVEYDASLVVSYKWNNYTKTRAWVYQGLTRRDPTLQIYEGLTYKTASVDILPNNPSSLIDARTLTVAFGGPDGSNEKTDIGGNGRDGDSVTWLGPSTTQETAHALIWEKDVNSDFPTKFLAFDSALVALSELATAHSKASFDLSPDTIASGTIVGTVPGSGFVERWNNVFLRYTSNAVIKLVDDEPGSPGFSYLVPTIPNASVTFVAGDGDVQTELGVVHKDGLTPNTSGISVTIPTPTRELAVSPAADSGKVSATTQFDFKRGGSANSPFVAVFTFENDPIRDEVLYVVSAKTPFKLPKVVNGAYSLLPGGTYFWRVETHGAPASVDAMVGPTGFLDSLGDASSHDEPSGPRMGDGSYTLSRAVELQIAP